jgi:hypothetical protein
VRFNTTESGAKLYPANVFTGSDASGVGDPGFEIGQTNIRAGVTTSATSWAAPSILSSSEFAHIYVISEILTVSAPIPTLSGWGIGGLAGSLLTMFLWFNRWLTPKNRRDPVIESGGE